MDIAEISHRLHRWLVDGKRVGERVDNVQMLSGGFSQLMVAFDLHTAAGSRRLVLRASRPAGEAITATDRDAEWAVITALCRRGDVPMPAGLWFDEGAALGGPCFVVEYIEGQTLTKRLASAADAELSSAADRLCDLLVVIHAVPLDALPGQLTRPADWASHIDALIEKWRSVERSGLEPDPVVRYLANWLETHKPSPAPLCLVHGEVNNDNLMVRPDGELAAVDWEFAHIGDPREDLGWYRTVSAAVAPDVMAQDVDGFCARYRSATGLSEDVINPAAVGYFALLSSVSVYSTLVGGPAAVESSAESPVLAAYLSAILASSQLQWLDRMHALEPALSVAPVAPAEGRAPSC